MNGNEIPALRQQILAFFEARPQATDLCLHGGTGQAWADCGHGMEPHSLEGAPLTDRFLKDWVLQELSLHGKSWDSRSPFVDATLERKLRLHAIFPPVSPAGIQISLRRLPGSSSAGNSAALRAQRWRAQVPESSEPYDLLRAAVLRKESILIGGATGSGKTTLLRDLASEIPFRERLIALEDTPELWPDHPQFIHLLSRPANADGFGEVSLRSLFKQTLRMRPDRILLGECRGGEVLELLQALHTGHSGALATLHSNSPRDSLARLELLALLSGTSGLSPSTVRELIATGVQWVVQVSRVESTGGRSVEQIARVRGKEGDTILLEPRWKRMVDPSHDVPNLESPLYPHAPTSFPPYSRRLLSGI